MSDLWLPPGAKRFDDEIERVIAESDDPEQMRESAELLREGGFSFPQTDKFGAHMDPEKCLLLFAEKWTRFENERGEWPLAAFVKSDVLERMILDSTLHYENGFVVDWVENPLMNAMCPALMVRLKEFQLFCPLALPERPQAPDDWKQVVQLDGFAFCIEQEDERFLYFSTGPCAPAAGLVMPARERTKVGRNDPCPCGSGVKFKRCCGR